MSDYKKYGEAVYFAYVFENQLNKLKGMNNPDAGSFNPSHILNENDIKFHTELGPLSPYAGDDLILFALEKKNLEALGIILNQNCSKCYVTQNEKNISKTIDILIEKTKESLENNSQNTYTDILFTYLRQFPDCLDIIKNKDNYFFSLLINKLYKYTQKDLNKRECNIPLKTFFTLADKSTIFNNTLLEQFEPTLINGMNYIYLANCGWELMKCVNNKKSFIKEFDLYSNYILRNNEKMITNFFNSSMLELRDANIDVYTNIVFFLTDKNPQILTQLKNSNLVLFKEFSDSFLSYVASTDGGPKTEAFNNFKITLSNELKNYYSTFYNNLKAANDNKDITQKSEMFKVMLQ